MVAGTLRAKTCECVSECECVLVQDQAAKDSAKAKHVKMAVNIWKQRLECKQQAARPATLAAAAAAMWVKLTQKRPKNRPLAKRAVK